MLQDEVETEMFHDYVGQSLWAIESALLARFGQENKKPQYIELSHPEVKPRPMTADEIKQYILDKLR